MSERSWRAHPDRRSVSKASGDGAVGDGVEGAATTGRAGDGGDARLLHEERQARSEAERRVRQERAVLQAMAAILTSTSVEKATETIAESARVAVGADSVVIERVEEHDESIRVVASTGARRIPAGIELEKLQEAAELRARLMRGFSHDLKNPLGAARGHLDLLQMGLRGELTEEQAETVGRVRTAVGEALRLIDDLVELAQAEAGGLELVPETITVQETVDQVVSLYRAQAGSAQLTLNVSLAHDLPSVTTDGARVRQILGNLLSNAIKYTPAGGQIEITAEPPHLVERNGGCWIAIAVRDTGAGIPRERHADLFREFGRIAAREPGSGIGLAISQRLARALGGEITVQSEVGVGSTFTLWLPADS